MTENFMLSKVLNKSESFVILSHKNPDVDSIISGYMLEKLLKIRGYNAIYVIPDKQIDDESMATCLKYGVNAKNYQRDLPENSNIILVDHYETTFNGKIICIIDHHPTIKSISCDMYMNVPSCSTAMLIYNLDPIAFDVDDIRLVCIANLVDTCCFSSTKTKHTDKEWTIKVCNDNCIDYQELYTDGLCLTKMDDLKKAAIHGVKSYNYDGINVKSSYIQIVKVDEVTIDTIINYLKKELVKDSLYMWVFIVFNMKCFKSTAYLITSSGVEIIKYNIIASRGNTIMPPIEKRVMMSN